MNELNFTTHTPILENGVPRRVLKLGGSLLRFQSLGPTFRHWLAHQPRSLNIVVVGGGEQVEAIRQAQTFSGWTDDHCHDLALQAMGQTSQLAAELLQIPHTDDPQFAKNWVRSSKPRGPQQPRRVAGQSGATALIFDLSPLALQDASLPKTWDLTSDSLAAWLAQKWAISELILLKSRSAPCGWVPESRDFNDWVDPLFPEFATGLRVECVNLRSWQA
jgi:aspartokinase-like uncharacterized kinase